MSLFISWLLLNNSQYQPAKQPARRRNSQVTASARAGTASPENYSIDTAKERIALATSILSMPVARLSAILFPRIESAPWRQYPHDHDRAAIAIDHPEHAEDQLRWRFSRQRMNGWAALSATRAGSSAPEGQ